MQGTPEEVKTNPHVPDLPPYVLDLPHHGSDPPPRLSGPPYVPDLPPHVADLPTSPIRTLIQALLSRPVPVQMTRPRAVTSKS